MARSPLSIGKFLLIFISWWLIWAFLQTILLMGFGLSFGVAVSDSVVANTLVALSCGFVSNNLQYYLPKKERYWYILFLSVALSVLITIACKGILVPLLDNAYGDPGYANFFSRSWPVRFDIIFLQVGCMTILSVLWYSSEEEQRQMQRRTDAERLAKEAELFKLRQQLAPHFLFNSLNSISALITSQPEQARKMIQQLSDFLRGNVRKDEQQSVPLTEELQYLQLYLDIEKVRFGHRLTTVVNHDDASMGMKIPPMLLQPIVENAIKFGLYDTTETVTITIEARAEYARTANTGTPASKLPPDALLRSELSPESLPRPEPPPDTPPQSETPLPDAPLPGAPEYVVISVQNPFDPETSRPKQGTGFGLSSIQRRLYLLFARGDLFETRVEGSLFTTIVKIPQTTINTNI